MNILLVEDNKKLANNIADVLTHEGYQNTKCFTGQKGLKESLVNNYDAIILDLNLPDIDGIEVCQKIRQENKQLPILMLTARIDVNSKVNGLDSGADDYLTKPFLMDELLARIRALIRRNSTHKSTNIKLPHNIRLDISAQKVLKNKKEIKLSPTEYKILEFLALNQGETKSHLEIYESVWGSNNSDILVSDTLKVHIASLRKKLIDDIIKTVRSQGYLINKS
jgi:DNA-binding response OmpR family regulator